MGEELEDVAFESAVKYAMLQTMKTAQRKDILKTLGIPKRAVPKGILNAMGIFKGREKQILKELRAGRNEWEKRLARQWKLGLRGRKHVAR